MTDIQENKLNIAEAVDAVLDAKVSLDIDLEKTV
jgi:hypothetical protein